MKKYTKIAYIVLILLILLASFFIYKVLAKNTSDEDIRSKSLAEIKYIENKFSNLFNQINNINFEKYKISTSEIEQQETKKESSGDGQTQSGGESGSQGSSVDSKGGNAGTSQGTSESDTESSKEENKKYQLEETGILTGNTDINWNYMKNEVENMYTSLYPTTLDLYQTSANQEDVVSFNKEYDKLTKAVKDEDKENTLKELTILYNYLPKFADNCTNDEKEKIIIRTKNNIFKAYSKLDEEDWGQISQNINSAIQEFTRLVTNVDNKEKSSQYNINKAYIIINELQNAVIIEDKDVFLIKYKNLLEELQNI